MTTPSMTRRRLLAVGASLGAYAARPLHAGSPTLIDVKKDATCPCCDDWVAYLQAEGFTVTTEVLPDDLLARHKAVSAIPASAQSCHTGKTEGYMLEGHVPAADIRRLLSEKPDAVGLAVPGMVYGSPGMGPATERDAYDVLLIARDGTTTVFTSYPAA